MLVLICIDAEEEEKHWHRNGPWTFSLLWDLWDVTNVSFVWSEIKKKINDKWQQIISHDLWWWARVRVRQNISERTSQCLYNRLLVVVCRHFCCPEGDTLLRSCHSPIKNGAGLYKGHTFRILLFCSPTEHHRHWNATNDCIHGHRLRWIRKKKKKKKESASR